jgi:hypothetical protein
MIKVVLFGMDDDALREADRICNSLMSVPDEVLNR